MEEKKVENKSSKKTLTGLPENTEAALTYGLGWVTGLIFILMEKNNKKIRFHAMQSIVVFGVLNLITFVPVFRWTLAPILWIVTFVLWLVLIVKAYQGDDWELPVVGEFAKKQTGFK